MPYLMGGFPDLAASLAIGEAYADGGADLVELGVPFSDPLADGPVIHAAGLEALAAARRSSAVLEVGAALAGAPGRPDVLREHRLRPRLRAFAPRSRSADVSGLIVPDLPLEEAPELRAACDADGIALVPLVAPTTPPSGWRAIGARARGFLYAVSVVGTTGERAELDAGLDGLVARVGATEVPVAVGFGIAHARAGGRGGRGRRRRDRRQPARARGRGGRGTVSRWCRASQPLRPGLTSSARDRAVPPRPPATS